MNPRIKKYLRLKAKAEKTSAPTVVEVEETAVVEEVKVEKKKKPGWFRKKED